MITTSIVNRAPSARALVEFYAQFPLDLLKNSSHQNASKMLQILSKEDVFDLAELVKYTRKSMKLSQSKFAAQIGITVAKLINFEEGHTKSIPPKLQENLPNFFEEIGIEEWILDIYIKCHNHK